MNHTANNSTHDTSEQLDENSMLIIEDDPTLATYAKKVLQINYPNILVASDGTEAINIINTTRRRLDILSDYNLRGQISGLDVAIITAEKRKSTLGRFIIGSGTSNPEVLQLIEHQIRAGVVNGFLEKPFSIKTLRDSFSR